MKKITLVFLVILAAGFHCIAQCDPKLYEAMKRTDPPFTLLKRYSIQVKEIPDVPFNSQYSYVFTKGSTYAFTLQPSNAAAKNLAFTLTNTDGDVLNNEFVTIPGKYELITYKAPKTGIYYLNVHASRSFDGCAVLQLSYNQYGKEEVFTESQRQFMSKFKATDFTESEIQLKEFVANANKKSEYSYVLSKDWIYGLYIEKQDPSVPLTLSIKKGRESIVSNMEIPGGKSFLHIIRPSETALYYFTFKNTDKDAIGMARLLKIDTITE